MKKQILMITILAIFLSSLYLYFELNNNSTDKEKKMSLYKKIKLEQEKNRKERKKTPGSFHYLKLFNTLRSYPDQDIKRDAYASAVEHNRSMKHTKNGEQWVSIGPKNIGGRTLDIAIDPSRPDTVFAASSSGGLWKSLCGGMGENAWSRIDIGYPGLAVSAVEIDPVCPDTIYIGTGEIYGYYESYPGVANRVTRGMYGIGILRSFDGGNTWSKSLDWSYDSNRGIQRIKIDPFDHKSVWAATTEGVYLSEDAGETWKQMMDIPMVTDLIIYPDLPDVIIAGCGGMWSTGHGIYRSSDRGITWNKFNFTEGPVTFGGKVRLDYSRSSPNIAYASIGYSDGENLGATWLCKTIDYGASWTVVNTTNYADYQGWYSHFVAVSPHNPDIIFCGGIHLWRSVNGGSTMSYYEGTVTDQFDPDWLHLDHHDMEFHPLKNNIIYSANDGGIHRSDDGGITYVSCNWGYQTSQFYNGFTCSETDSLFAIGGLQDNYTCIYRGNENWDRVIGGDGSCSAMSQTDNNIVFGSWQYLNILKSVDKGYNFDITSTPGNTGTVNFISPYVICPSNPKIMYAGGSRIARSRDQGNNWSVMSEFPVDLPVVCPAISMDVSRQNEQKLYVATIPVYSSGKIDKKVFRTDNGGSGWTDITTGLPNNNPTDIVTDPNNDNIVYITFGGFEQSQIFKSNDSGITWINISEGLPNIPGWSVIPDPFNPEHIYFGNELGVYFSPDGGSSWQLFSEGLGDGVFAMDMKISYSDKKIKLATHGNGAYERKLVSAISGIESEDDQIADSYKLYQNYPNPFNNETIIKFSLNDPAISELSVYNSKGELVQNLFSGKLNKGTHSFTFKPDKINTGVYFYRLSVNGVVKETMKMTYLK